ncbi:MAG: hypothetical protein M3O46_10545, partial [Myxococcota bacterium]|nr:hypothetical protein [Myxococcota bacterium]
MRVCGMYGAALALLAAAFLGSTPAWAEEPTPTAQVPSPKRPLPDYEGRGPAPTTAGDVAIWVPRIIVSPIYFTTEFLIRRPLGAVVSAAERANLPTILYNFFTFGPEHKAGFAPIAFIDFGFNPSFGVYVFWDDAGFKGNDFRLHLEGWSSDWLAGSLTERIHFYEKDTLTFRLSAIRRPDHVFYGIGPNTLESDRSRHGEEKLDGSAHVDFALWRSSRVQAGIGVRSVSLYHGHYGHDPSL